MKPLFCLKISRMAFLCQDINTLGSSDIDVHVGSLFHLDQFTEVFIPSKQLHSRVSRLHNVWAASAGAVLQCDQEARNSNDPYAVAVQKDGLTVGHVPRTVSCICSVFVRRGGSIVCTILERESTPVICHREVWKCLVLTPLVVGAVLNDFQFLSYCLSTWMPCGSWQALGKGVYSLKVILDCLLSHFKQRDVCLLQTIRLLYVHIVRNFAFLFSRMSVNLPNS